MTDLNLEAKVGDTVVVTFMSANRGIQTIERINDRRVFLDRKSPAARRGDTCRVKITGQNPSGSVYFVSVDAILKTENGQASFFERILRTLGIVEEVANYSGADTALALIAARFGGDVEEQLQFLLRLLKYIHVNQYTLGGITRDSFLALVDAAEDLIAKAYAQSNPWAQADSFMKLSQTCNACSQKALDYAVKSLDSLDKCVGNPSYEQKLSELLLYMERLGQLQDGVYPALRERILSCLGVDHSSGIPLRRHFSAARNFLAADDPDSALSVLLPFYGLAKNDNDSSQRQDLCRLLGEAYLQKSDFTSAVVCFGECDVSDSDHDLLKLMADAHYGGGNIATAASLYKLAYEKCLADWTSTIS